MGSSCSLSFLVSSSFCTSFSAVSYGTSRSISNSISYLYCTRSLNEFSLNFISLLAITFPVLAQIICILLLSDCCNQENNIWNFLVLILFLITGSKFKSHEKIFVSSAKEYVL